VEEDVPGVLIVRIRDNLDFANTAQLKGTYSPFHLAVTALFPDADVFP
jgi:hypothetical protein